MDSLKIRSMTYAEIYEYHRATYPVPQGMTYDEVVRRINILCKKFKFKPTKEQLHAVLSRGKPLVINSVPGSGKTTISEFIIYVDYQIHGISPERMLLTTFSNQGAVAMQRKNLSYARALGVDPAGTVNTMHSWYKSFLVQFSSYLNISSIGSQLTQIDENTSRGILKDCYCSVTGTNALFVPPNFINDLHSVYTTLVDMMLMWNKEVITNLPSFKKLKLDYNKFKTVIESYMNTKRTLGHMDFSDMQTYFYELIRDNEAVRNKISSYFDRILIDEYQDTSRLQFEIYKLLVNDKNRDLLLVIGDDDQSIYRWRGAERDIFTRFLTTYKDARLVTLGYNMRSAKEIIKYANQLISHTPERIEKHMTTPNTFEGTVDVKGCKSRIEAVDYIYSKLAKFYKENSGNIEAYKTQCVLSRNHNQALWLVDKCLDNKIPVRLLGETFPYNDKIFLDLQDIISSLSSPRDIKLAEKALPKIVKEFTSKNKTTIQIQMTTGAPIYDIKLEKINNKNSTYEDDMLKIKTLCNMVNQGATLSDLCKIILPLYMNGSYEYYAKQKNIEREHYTLIFEYLLSQDISVNQFNLKILRIRTQLAENESMDIGIRICSMHGAKGLEFDTVYILDMNSNNLPSDQSISELSTKQAYEYIADERNLCYVAITRAIRNLVVTYNSYCPSLFNTESGLIEQKDINKEQKLPTALVNYISARKAGLPLEAEQSKQPQATNKSTPNKQTYSQSKTGDYRLKVNLNKRYKGVLDLFS